MKNTGRPTAFVLAMLAFCLLGASSAFAQSRPAAATSFRDDTPEADAALASGNWPAAVSALDERIASHPQDVQARFKRATVLARTGHDTEAASAFQGLIREFPELPEPYNNLAALQAKAGQLDEARVTLETALKASPGYALAQRNLGDVYLRLAARSYEKAGSQDPVARSRAATIQTVLSPPRPRAPSTAKAADAADAASTVSAASAAAASNAANASVVPYQGARPGESFMPGVGNGIRSR